jgi:hypothetical protein
MVPAPEVGAATVSVYEDVATTPWQPARQKLIRIVRHSDAKRFLDVKGASPGEHVLDVEGPHGSCLWMLLYASERLFLQDLL